MESLFWSTPSPEALDPSLTTLSYGHQVALASTPKDSEKKRATGLCLSTRELTIVLLMGHGLSNKSIARQLSITPETVKSHAKHIFCKLTVQTRAQAVYRASSLGLI
jgi:ATP/maltotriose-dependent transcriptional regulator MalT